MCPFARIWAPWEGSCGLHVPPVTNPHFKNAVFSSVKTQNSTASCIIQGTTMNSSSLTALLGELCQVNSAHALTHQESCTFQSCWRCLIPFSPWLCWQTRTEVTRCPIPCSHCSCTLGIPAGISVCSLSFPAPAGLSCCPNFSRAS